MLLITRSVNNRIFFCHRSTNTYLKSLEKSFINTKHGLNILKMQNIFLSIK
jgi:hypothetical protein